MDNKQAYAQKIDAQLDQWSARIDHLKAKAKEAGADAAIDYNKRIDDLQNRISAVATKKKELENTASDKWEDVKSRMDRTLDETKKQFDRVVELVTHQ